VHLLYRDEAPCNFMKISKFRIQKKLYNVVFDHTIHTLRHG
jgi:hypothetical protein